MHRHALIDGDAVRRKGQLRCVEFEMLQEPLMTPLLRVAFDIFDVDIRVLDAAFEQRRVPVVGA